jgi:hypothetical protein
MIFKNSVSTSQETHYSSATRITPLTPQLYSRGWVNPVPDPLLLGKSDSAWIIIEMYTLIKLPHCVSKVRTYRCNLSRHSLINCHCFRRIIHSFLPPVPSYRAFLGVALFCLWKFYSCWYYTGDSKRALRFWKLIHIYSEDMHSVLKCNNVANYTKFYVW